ncbi:hypothetical protein [Brevibacterium litoralis]|uniref:hypothetical protein n=1 Tax=Brevibacterium litoralis TaxID=3138935 RepID=UPI0032EABDA0
MTLDVVHALYASRKFDTSQYAPYSVSGAGHAVGPELKRDQKLLPLLEAQFLSHLQPAEIAEHLNGMPGRHRLIAL